MFRTHSKRSTRKADTATRFGFRCVPATPGRTLKPRQRIKNFAELVAAAIPEHARGKPLELWWQE